MIEIRNLGITLGEFHLHDVNLTVHDGEYMVLLGETGVGKTVVIECIVGIYRQNHGSILVDGQDVTPLYIEERNIGYVPQDYALFPNLTVYNNIAYGLATRKMPRDAIAAKVEPMMDLLNVSHLRNRLPLNLSGGEKQRTALGRALVTEPRILLLDEPLSALDENTRSELSAELRRIHDAVGGTFLQVCHNFEEASDVADRIAILNAGTVVQTGTIDEILSEPASPFVARFTRTRNILDARAEPYSGGCVLDLGRGHTLDCAREATGPVTVTIRPEKIGILPAGAAISENNCLSGRIIRTTLKPNWAEVAIETDRGPTLIAYIPRSAVDGTLTEGSSVCARIAPGDIRVFDKDAT